MALLQLSLPSPVSCFSIRQQKLITSHISKFRVFCCLSNDTKTCGNSVARRSANYKPPIWKHEFLQSLSTNEFKEETYSNKMEELKKAVKVIINEKMSGGESLEQLELIDTLQRLGVSYHFVKEIKQILENVNHRFHEREDIGWKKDCLHSTALQFRILRQHGYFIPQDVFIGFKDEIESVNEYVCEEKAKGMLSLCEASYLAVEGESLLDEARHFTLKYLEKYMSFTSNDEEIFSSMVRHALELPLHWRMSKLEARWFIDIYQRKQDMNPIYLELAKLDFNFVQSKHQQELKDMSSWWMSTGIVENPSFLRDRLISNFLSAVGMVFEPSLGDCRRMCTKINSLLTVIDDIYDIYGTLDELQLFTDAVKRWDVDAIDSLPDYMKVCFLAIHNIVNDIAFDILKDQKVNLIPYFKKMWANHCKRLLMEATWYHNNQKPTLREYLDNAFITTGGPVILFHVYVSAIRPINRSVLESLIDHDILQHSSMIFRLTNDLTTSSDEMKRGDVLKSVQCYMNDTGASEEEALKCIKDLIIESWKKMNKIVVLNSSYFSPIFTEIALNLGRIGHTFYQHGDGFGVEDQKMKDHVISLFVKPI